MNQFFSTPFLTIIIPCHNGELFLNRCMESVLPQLDERCELFLVDDSSTDQTPELCDAFASDRIHVLHVSCNDPADARNAAIQKAQGEYIWCVDSDDYIEPNAAEVITRALAESRPDILRFSYYREEDGSVVKTEDPFQPGIYTGEILSDMKHYAVGWSDIAPFFIWLHVYRTELLQQVPLLPLKTHLSECNSLAQRIYPRAEKIHVLGDALYHYVIRRDSLSFHPIPYSYQALNRYCAIRDDLIALGLYEEYRADVAFCVMDRLFLRLLRRENCVFMTEYLLCEDIEIAHGHVRDILSQPDFKELLKEAEKRDAAPSLRLCYRMMEQENEEGLYKLIKVFL